MRKEVWRDMGSEKAKEIDPKNSITITTGIYGEPASPFVQKLLGEKIKEKDNRCNCVIRAEHPFI